MALTSLITAATSVQSAELVATGNVVLVITKLARGEYVFVHVKGLAGDTEVAVQNRMPVVISQENNFVSLPGPCVYHVYKPLTAASVGVGYHEPAA
jgi:hypothetical protein